MARSPSEIIVTKTSLGLEATYLCAVTHKSVLLEQGEKEQQKLVLSTLRIPYEGHTLCFLLQGTGDGKKRGGLQAERNSPDQAPPRRFSPEATNFG